MKKQTLFDLTSMPKMVLIIAAIVLFGTWLGAVGYLMSLSEIDNSIIPLNKTEITKEEAILLVKEKCNKGTYYYNKTKKFGDKWRIPLVSFIEIDYYAEIDIKTGEINCRRYSGTIPVTHVSQKVVITTDKTEYEQGEIIKIVVNNGLYKSILYSGWGDRFWGIEYFKDDKWINPTYESGGGFQLTEKNVGDSCYVLLYERELPSKFKPQTNLSIQWNQRICPFGTEGPNKPKIVRYIESGKYRLAFSYGFEISSNDRFQISEPKTIYSNEFTIKEKSALDSRCSEKVRDLSGVNDIDCYVILPGYEYDSGLGKCTEKMVSGCSFETPFKSLEECQEVCEKNGDSVFPDEEELIKCNNNSDCVLVNSGCCGCSMGGGMICINKKYLENWNQKLKLDCKVERACPAVYLCDDNPTGCECVNNVCQGVKE